jgi:hypothetical protein
MLCLRKNNATKQIKALLDGQDFRATCYVLVESNEYLFGEDVIFLFEDEE